MIKNCRETKLKFFLLEQEIRTQVRGFFCFFFKAVFWGGFFLETNQERVIVLLVQLHIMSYGNNTFLGRHYL